VTVAILGVVALTVVLAPTAHAQENEVDRAEALVAAGDYAGARAALERWWQSPDGGDGAAPALRARALLLRARLATDPAVAEKDYLALAIGYPSAPEAPHALLALGQGLLATGDIPRAITYLERLVHDHPNSPLVPTGRLWLVRAHNLEGRRDAACEAARKGIAVAAGDTDLLALLRAEEAAACAAAANATAGATPAGTPAPQRDDASRTGENAANARYAIQAGAFRQARGAEELAERLRRAGFEPRIVAVPGSDLRRVRVGRFADPAAAAELIRRLRAAGFTAIVVDDAGSERAPR
jgi:tetratricopeptide (TPR) repeat protein